MILYFFVNKTKFTYNLVYYNKNSGVVCIVRGFFASARARWRACVANRSWSGLSPNPSRVPAVQRAAICEGRVLCAQAEAPKRAHLPLGPWLLRLSAAERPCCYNSHVWQGWRPSSCIGFYMRSHIFSQWPGAAHP